MKQKIGGTILYNYWQNSPVTAAAVHYFADNSRHLFITFITIVKCTFAS